MVCTWIHHVTILHILYNRILIFTTPPYITFFDIPLLFSFPSRVGFRAFLMHLLIPFTSGRHREVMKMTREIVSGYLSSVVRWETDNIELDDWGQTMLQL